MTIKQLIEIRRALHMQGVVREDFPVLALRLKEARRILFESGLESNVQIGERIRLIGFDIAVVWD